MSFSLASNVITQTGTDADLSGLSAISGVVTQTITAYYTRKVYIIPSGVRLVVNGTLSHDPKYEDLHFVGGDFNMITVAGTYNYGVSTEYTGCGLHFPFRTNQHWNQHGVDISSGGTFNWRGGLILGANTAVYANSGGILNVDGGQVWGAIGARYGGQNIYGWIGGYSLNVTNNNTGVGIRLMGAVSLDMGDNIEVNRIRFEKGAQISAIGSLTSWVRYKDCETDDPTAILVKTYDRKNLFVNWKNGTNVRASKVGAGNGSCQMEFYRNFQPFAKTPAGSAIQDAVFYIKDVNNGSRQTFTLQELGTASNQDYVYVAKTAASGAPSSAIKLYLGSVKCTTDISDTYDSGNGRYDRRFSDTAGSYTNTDTGTVYCWSYGHLADTFQQAFSDGTVGTLAPTRPLVADPNVSLSAVNAVSILASNFSVSLTGVGTVTVTATSTASDLYDALKAYKTRDVQAQLEFPAINTQPVTGSGTVLTTAMNITINSGQALNASAKFDTLTSSATVTGALTTGGAYTYVNGSMQLPSTTPVLTGGTINIGAAGTYGFCGNATIVSMTPTAPGTYIINGANCVDLDLRNTSGTHAITVQLPAGATYTTANNTGAAITVTFPVISNTATISGYTAQSHIIVHNVTKGTFPLDAKVATTPWSLSYNEGDTFEDGDIIDVYHVFVAADGTSATKKTRTRTTATSVGWSVTITEETCPVYAAYYATYSVTGATVYASGDFVRDGANQQIDLDDGDDSWYGHRMFLFDKYDIWHNTGNQAWFMKMTATDAANIDLGDGAEIDNLNANTAKQQDAINITADGGATIGPVQNPTTGGGGVTLFSGGKVLLASTGGISPSEAQIKAWIREELASELSDIVAIDGRLPSDPADNSQVLDAIAGISAGSGASLAEIEASTVLAKEATSAAIKAKTDSLAFTGDNVHAEAKVIAANAVNATAIASGAITNAKFAAGAIDAAAIADNAIDAGAIAANAITSAKIAAGAITATQAPNMDVATSTRLAAAGYTAPDNASVAAIKVRTDAMRTYADVSSNGETYGKQHRDILAAQTGVTLGGGTGTETFMEPDGITPRVVSNNDGTNRTSVSRPGA
jgi:hypothetical protein